MTTFQLYKLDDTRSFEATLLYAVTNRENYFVKSDERVTYALFARFICPSRSPKIAPVIMRLD